MTVFRGTCINCILPQKSNCFKEEEVSEIFNIPCDKPKIKEVHSISVHPEVGEVRLVETEIGKSNEGQILTGIKLVIEINLKEKITYVADEKMQYIYALSNENLKSFFIILPTEINEENTKDLLRAKRINIIPYIEAVSIRKINSYSIFKCLSLFIDVKVC
ncbi:MAG: hypothetical protein ACRCTQ_02970 [Brevinemataceae bacterium]